jgi:hypothetical protein
MMGECLLMSNDAMTIILTVNATPINIASMTLKRFLSLRDLTKELE